MNRMSRAISAALAAKRPVLVYSEPGSGAVYSSMEALGPDARRISCSVLDPSLSLPGSGSFGGLADLVKNSPAVLLDEADRVQSLDVMVEIRDFLASESRPIVVVVSGEPSAELEERLFQGIVEFSRVDWRDVA